MHLSIIVPAFNEERLLGPTLAAIRDACPAFHRRSWTTELIVCDNNSTDRTPQIARDAGARVVFEPVNQIGRARNAGAAAATGDWLIFIDADSTPTEPLFEAVAGLMAGGRVMAGGAALTMDDSRWWFRALTECWVCWSRLARHMAGSFIFCQTSAFREIGGFSPSLYAAEELDLSQRLKRLARQRGQAIRIITHPRLLTSARKTRLYTPREILGFFMKTAMMPRRMLTDPRHCHLWYDGRR